MKNAAKGCQSDKKVGERSSLAVIPITCGVSFAFDSFNYLVQQTCVNRNIPVPVVFEVQYNSLVILLNQLNQQWKRTETGQTVMVKF